MPDTIEYRVQKLEERVAENEEKNTKAHKEFYDEFKNIAIHKALETERHTQIITKLELMQSDIAQIKGTPSKRWNDFIKSIITAFGGVIGGAILVGLIQLLGGG